MSIFKRHFRPHSENQGSDNVKRFHRIPGSGNVSSAEAERISADPGYGLTEEQVRLRRQQGLSNIPPAPPSKSVGEIIYGNVFTYFNFIFLVIAALIIYTGSYRDLTFMPVIIANTCIGIIQELRSKRVLDRLTVLNAPSTTVIRNGTETSVPSKELVLDDIAVFRAGDQITADSVVVSGSVSVNESLLTGESDEISKSTGDTLMSGSFIVSGTCRARLEKVGAESYISSLTIQVKKLKHGEQSEMIRSLNRIVMIAGIAVIPIGLILFFHQHLTNGDSFNDSIRSTMAAIIGMIPEGLFLLASTTLAISAMRLALNKVLVHDMKCIETLARVDVLCVDKTGTITEGTMSVTEVIPLSVNYTQSETEIMLSDLCSAQSADNATMEALKTRFSQPSGSPVTQFTGFSPEFKYSSAVVRAKGRDISLVLGAPEFILGEGYESYRDLAEIHSRRGARVLVLAEYSGTADGKKLTGSSTAVCFVILANNVREKAKETFAFFREQGVTVKVISGDNPVTVSEVARQAGIDGCESYIDASTLTTDSSVAAAASKYTVFGRVTPEQKRRLIRALKAAGHTVAMTGDGVNDVLALKDADCSVAMASGSDAASQVSQLVLLESDFARMPEVVMEGRKVVNNLERSGSLFLVKNIFSLLMSLVTIFWGISYPFVPSQITLISMFTIGIPAFFLSQVPDRELIRGRFMTNILLKALPAGITDTVMVSAIVFFGSIFSLSEPDISSGATILLAAVGLMILFRISMPMNSYKWGIWIFCVIGICTGVFLLNGIFCISPVSFKCLLLCANFAIIAEPMLRYLAMLINKTGEVFTGAAEQDKK